MKAVVPLLAALAVAVILMAVTVPIHKRQHKFDNGLSAPSAADAAPTLPVTLNNDTDAATTPRVVSPAPSRSWWRPTIPAQATSRPHTATPTAAQRRSESPGSQVPSSPVRATPTADRSAEKIPEDIPPGLPPLPHNRPAPTAAQWAALRNCESGGDYQIVSSNGKWHGAWQAEIPTWRALWDRIGRPDIAHLAPEKAPREIQDYFAALLYQQRGGQPWPVCSKRVGL